MQRRLLLSRSTHIALGSALYLTLPMAQAQPGYTVSEALLQQAVAKRFPRLYSMNGLVDLNLQAPQLRLLPDQNRLGAELALGAAGPALRRAYTGRFDIDFALRYEPSDLSIRVKQLRVNALQLNDLPPQPSALLAAYGPTLAEQALQDATLHRLRPQDLAVPDSLGLQPGNITVTAQGLLIEFVAKPLS